MVETLVYEATWVAVRQARKNGGRNRLEGEGTLPEVRKAEIRVHVVCIKGYESGVPVDLFIFVHLTQT